MNEAVSSMLRDNDMCVLATAGPEGPYTSLMGYVWDPEQLRIYLLLRKGSAKYANIRAEPRVSLLIDDRVRHATAPHDGTQALSVSGMCAPMTEPDEAQRAQDLILARLPHLAAIAAYPDATVLRVEPTGFQLLRDIENALFLKIP